MHERAGRSVERLVDHLFRREVGRIVSRLAREFGLHRLAVVEDAVQFAMMQALQRWPYHGIPEHPKAWLLRVAANHTLDQLRVESRTLSYDGDGDAEADDPLRREVERVTQILPPEGRFANELSDDELSLMFACCHPSLPVTSSVALTLKVVCGLGADEIARAFLVSIPTIEQRLVRAKKAIREKGLQLDVPAPPDLPGRLELVLQVLYLLFTEGYAPTAGDQLLKQDLCADALRLTDALAANALTARPECHALLALMLFQAARFGSRMDAAGDLLLLDEQDRSLWDRSMISAGVRALERAGRGNVLTTYHLQAEIAAAHACSVRFDLTEWSRILALYDLLLDQSSTAVVRLNRAVAVCQVEGPQAALAALGPMFDDGSSRTTAALWMAAGEFERLLGHENAAFAHLHRALPLLRTEPERRFVQRKLALLERASGPGRPSDG